MLAWLILCPQFVHSHDSYWLWKYCIVQWIVTLWYVWVVMLTCPDMFKNNMVTIPRNFTVIDVESAWRSIHIATHSSAFFHKFTTLLLSIHNSFTSTNIPTTSTQPFCHNTTSTSTRTHTLTTSGCVVPATDWLNLPAVDIAQLAHSTVSPFSPCSTRIHYVPKKWAPKHFAITTANLCRFK